MSLRDQLGQDLKTALRAGDALRVSTIRLVLARLKEADIAARPAGAERIPDDAIAPLLRSMIKQRRDSVALYRQGNRPELADREEAEIAIIAAYLPAGLDGPALAAAVDAAIAATGAATGRDTGRVMAALKATHGTAIDMAAAGALLRGKLAG